MPESLVKMDSHSAGGIAVICVGFLVYAVALVISYMSSNPSIDPGNTVTATQADISLKYITS